METKHEMFQVYLMTKTFEVIITTMLKDTNENIPEMNKQKISADKFFKPIIKSK